MHGLMDELRDSDISQPTSHCRRLESARSEKYSALAVIPVFSFVQTGIANFLSTLFCKRRTALQRMDHAVPPLANGLARSGSLWPTDWR